MTYETQTDYTVEVKATVTFRIREKGGRYEVLDASYGTDDQIAEERFVVESPGRRWLSVEDEVFFAVRDALLPLAEGEVRLPEQIRGRALSGDDPDSPPSPAPVERSCPLCGHDVDHDERAGCPVCGCGAIVGYQMEGR